MKIEYADLLSGDPIFVEGAGHIRSPYLYEIKPTSGIGWFKYALYLNVFVWDKAQVLKTASVLQVKGLKAFDGKENLTAYDILILIPQTRAMLQNALSFFITEKVEWNEIQKTFFVSNDDGELVGQIGRNNFSEVASTVLNLNYVKTKKQEQNPTKYRSEDAKKMWEQVKEFQQQTEKPSEGQEDYTLGNIISKLCCIHASYNLLNVYNLTVFQLYDQFYQCVYLKQSDLKERIFSIHGGDDFKVDDWIKQINEKNEGE